MICGQMSRSLCWSCHTVRSRDNRSPLVAGIHGSGPGSHGSSSGSREITGARRLAGDHEMTGIRWMLASGRYTRQDEKRQCEEGHYRQRLELAGYFGHSLARGRLTGYRMIAASSKERCKICHCMGYRSQACRSCCEKWAGSRKSEKATSAGIREKVHVGTHERVPGTREWVSTGTRARCERVPVGIRERNAEWGLRGNRDGHGDQ